MRLFRAHRGNPLKNSDLATAAGYFARPDSLGTVKCCPPAPEEQRHFREGGAALNSELFRM